jgi:MFS family permease
MVISVVVEPLKAEYGLSDSQIGILSGVAFSAPFAIASLPVGWLLDRVRRVTALSVMLVLWSLATMLCALPLGYHALFGFRMLVGAAEAGAHPACVSLIADKFPPERRSSALGIFASGSAISLLVMYLVGGWLQLHYDWRTVFLMAGIPGIALALLIFLTLREPVRGIHDSAEAGGVVASDGGVPRKPAAMRETLTMLIKSRPLRNAIIGHLLSSGAQFAIVIWMVSFLTRLHGMPSAKAAIAMGFVMGISQTVGSLVAGPVLDRISRGSSYITARWVAFLCVLSSCAGLVMLSMPTLNGVLAVLCVQTFLAGMSLPSSYSLLVGTTNAHGRATTLAFSRLVSTLIGNSGLGFLAGFVSDQVGGPGSIRVGLIVVMFSLIWAAGHYLAVARAVGTKAKTNPPLAA